MKKVLITFIIIAYLNSYLGCMSTKTTSYSASALGTENELDMYVVTKDSEKYKLKSNTFKTIDDTLVGRGCAIIEGEEQKLKWVKIAVNDIGYGYSTEEQISFYTYVGIALAIPIIVYLAIKDKEVITWYP